MLERMLEEAERSGDPGLAPAVLEVAGAGLDRSPLDGDALIVRDLAGGALRRAFAASDAFATEVLATARGDREVAHRPAVGARVAALHALQLVDGDAARAARAAGLTGEDPRVRLAAVETLRDRAELPDLEPLVAALRVEDHPVVAQALVQAVGAVVDRGGDALEAGRREVALAAVLDRLGTVGWRTDVEIVDLVARQPIRPAVPRLIDLLEEGAGAPRRLRDDGFAPVVRQRALSALRRITGALLPGDEAGAWREFWAAEGPDIELVARPAPNASEAATSGGFFGIDVQGRETAFVLDVSQSMRRRVGGVGEDAERSRLDVAVRQLLEAAQDMPRAWRFQVVAFADEPRVWEPRGSRADRRALRALTAFLARQEPGGRSDLRAALRVALGAEGLRFGGRASEHAIDEVFVLSDGIPADADGPVDADELLAWVREVNRYQKIRIHTVMAGEGRSGAEFLRRLAEQNDGRFVQR
jgi:hypothetical protein